MAASNPSGRAYFEQQREALMGEIAMVIKINHKKRARGLLPQPQVTF